MAKKLIRNGFPPIIIKDDLPPAPEGVPLRRWHDCQLALRHNARVPKEVVATITTLREMNMWVFMCVQLPNDWRVILENREDLLRKSTDPLKMKLKGV